MHLSPQKLVYLLKASLFIIRHEDIANRNIVWVRSRFPSLLVAATCLVCEDAVAVNDFSSVHLHRHDHDTSELECDVHSLTTQSLGLSSSDQPHQQQMLYYPLCGH